MTRKTKSNVANNVNVNDDRDDANAHVITRNNDIAMCDAMLSPDATCDAHNVDDVMMHVAHANDDDATCDDDARVTIANVARRHNMNAKIVRAKIRRYRDDIAHLFIDNQYIIHERDVDAFMTFIRDDRRHHART